jgi:hypothetical protein
MMASLSVIGADRREIPFDHHWPQVAVAAARRVR